MRESKRRPLVLPAKQSIFVEIFQPPCLDLHELSHLFADSQWQSFREDNPLMLI